MSRRRGEFEHRTSIFEGAYRAWSHLGGIAPSMLESKSVEELDPLDFPLKDDPRLAADKRVWTDPEGNVHRFYYYEPLPRTGLAHPYVQAILSPWLGPDADQDAIALGLATLRTWWQHRRKGESPSAVVALSSEKMKGVIEGYTRHFFNLAYCLVVNDSEQAPRTLGTKMKELEKSRKHNKRKRKQEAQAAQIASTVAVYTATVEDPAPPVDLDDSNLTPLEKLHAAQRRQLAESGGVTITGAKDVTAAPLINMKGKCIPGKLDLSSVVDAVSHQASQLAYRGGSAPPNQVLSGGFVFDDAEYGDPNLTPVVFVSGNGDIQIAMSVDGITCAHCVKIVETVLKGCSGNRSPIDGLLDAAADRILCQVLIKIDRSSSAKRIAFESTRNLSMVGYTARVKEMGVVNAGGDKKATSDLGALSTAFEVIASTEPQAVFDWSTPCTCPDNGVQRDDCARHSQMNTLIFEAFETREQQVKDYMAGCGQKYGMPCTCGPNCRCRNCEEHCASSHHQQDEQIESLDLQSEEQILRAAIEDPTVATLFVQNDMPPPQPNLFGTPRPSLTSVSMASAAATVADTNAYHGSSSAPGETNVFVSASTVSAASNVFHPAQAGSEDSNAFNPTPGGANPADAFFAPASSLEQRARPRNSIASRNPSILSFQGLKRMSFPTETTFGRAMSGLSALSIDWENMEDFDVNVDHSAHINNDYVHGQTNEPLKLPTDGIEQNCNMTHGGDCNCGPSCICAGCPVHDSIGTPPASHYAMPRASILRKLVPGEEKASDAQVTFNM